MIEKTVEHVDHRLTTHEAVCAERYINIIFRMGRMEKMIMVAAGTLIVGMAGLIIKLGLH
jgi:hypothetical protein